MAHAHLYIKPVPGFPHFAMLAASALLDPSLGDRSLRVLSILALHADKAGEVHERVTHSFIAECLGIFNKGLPKSSAISAAIRPLIELGYLTSHGQRGFNGTTIYRLSTPEVLNNTLVRPVVDAPKSEKAQATGPRRQLPPTALPVISGFTDKSNLSPVAVAELAAKNATVHAAKKSGNEAAGAAHRASKSNRASRGGPSDYSAEIGESSPPAARLASATKRQVVEDLLAYSRGLIEEITVSDYDIRRYGFEVPDYPDEFPSDFWEFELSVLDK